MRRSVDGLSVLSNDDFAEYDFVSDGHRSLESSIADLGFHDAVATRREPPPSEAAKTLFGTPGLSSEDIQAYVQKTLGLPHYEDGPQRAVRVYVDGKFDPLNAGHALRLRQAKLSFPAVHVLVGVFRDEVCEQHGQRPRLPHVERCELVRHCRWVDEVVEDAPWSIDEAFVHALRIDYVAIDEGASVDPAYERDRVRGYDLVKSLRKAIPTRKTLGLTQLNLESDPAPVAEIPAASESKGSNGTLRKKPAPAEDESENDPFREPLIDLLQ